MLRKRDQGTVPDSRLSMNNPIAGGAAVRSRFAEPYDCALRRRRIAWYLNGDSRYELQSHALTA